MNLYNILSALNFKIEKKLDNALGRAGILSTPHGDILTPAFVAVGTKATVKGLTPENLKALPLQVVLGNTYHLYLQPGDELVKQAGGIGKFMGWNGPTMTDSGGFQVFSLGVAYGKQISKVTKITDPSLIIPERSSVEDGLAPLVKIGADGVSFRSHLDGSLHYFTPEKSIEIQHNLGADMIFAFDECTSPTENTRYQEDALTRTHNWAKRCLDRHKELEAEKLQPHPNPLLKGEGRTPQALFGIVQGGRDENLRKKSAEYIGSLDFDGFGIGGSFAKEDMETAVKWVNEILPEEKPRHLLGIGEPEDLFMGVENGVDLFDCVAPTRNARSGASLYTKNGRMNLMNSEYRNDFSPIEIDCECYACKNFTRAYISHLFHAKEMLGGELASIHNLYFISNLVAKMREHIIDGTFFEFKENFLKEYNK